MTYAQHSIWTNPGKHSERLSVLTTDPRDLADALENFLIHHASARFLNFGVPDYAESDRNLRSVKRLLTVALERDDRPLTEHRDLSAYLYGTCHDFALIAVSVFRSKGIEARLRVGFVDYLRQGRWEDHWLCEYRIGKEWRLLDAQMGKRTRKGHGIEFAIDNIPRHHFRSGSNIWLAIRSGEIDSAMCGVSFAGISGEWFPASNVLRDAAALSAIETLPWDYWGLSRKFGCDQSVSLEAQAKLDTLADAYLNPPESVETANSLLDKFSWAKPGNIVLSYVDGKFREQSIMKLA